VAAATEATTVRPAMAVDVPHPVTAAGVASPVMAVDTARRVMVVDMAATAEAVDRTAHRVPGVVTPLAEAAATRVVEVTGNL